ncbi:WbqC family protein [Myxococcota bacterium]|nr:WbqC family protein [Myxococcota bacterium]
MTAPMTGGRPSPAGRLGMMQPYFLPYLGYFALIRATDAFVLFDEAQYIRHGWVNRNRVLHPAEGWQYVGIPLRKHSREARIMDVRICADGDWRGRILRQLQHYRRAPHYAPVMAMLEDALAVEGDLVRDLLARSLERTCAFLGLPFRPLFSSSLDYDREAVRAPGDWARAVARALGARAYVNPAGGRELFDPEDWRREGMDLRFLALGDARYDQGRPAFEPHLSVVDALMFNAPERVRAMLDDVVWG